MRSENRALCSASSTSLILEVPRSVNAREIHGKPAQPTLLLEGGRRGESKVRRNVREAKMNGNVSTTTARGDSYIEQPYPTSDPRTCGARHSLASSLARRMVRSEMRAWSDAYSQRSRSRLLLPEVFSGLYLGCFSSSRYTFRIATLLHVPPGSDWSFLSPTVCVALLGTRIA